MGWGFTVDAKHMCSRRVRAPLSGRHGFTRRQVERVRRGLACGVMILIAVTLSHPSAMLCWGPRPGGERRGRNEGKGHSGIR